MNDNIDLTEILRYCPKGIKLYSPIFGDVILQSVRPELDENAIIVDTPEGGRTAWFSRYGIYLTGYNGECLLFPDKEQRDWAKFKPDLAIDTPVMVSADGVSWELRYYAGNHMAYVNGLNSNTTIVTSSWEYVIPFVDILPPLKCRDSRMLA